MVKENKALTINDLMNAVSHKVDVLAINGIHFNGICTEYQPPQDEDEKHNITVQSESGLETEINIDEIVSIRVLS